MNIGDTDAEIVRRAYEVFNAGDITTLLETFDENACWHSPGRGSIAGDHIGRDAVIAQFGKYGGETGGTAFKATLKTILRSDDGCVVGIHRNTGERNGKRLDVGCCIVFQLKDGRIIDGREHFYDLHAWENFWS